MQVKPEVERFAKIRVVGVGGAGGNVLDSMIESQQIIGVEFVAINTDSQDLSISKASVKIPIGQELTSGLGAGADPETGKRAAEESRELLKANLEGADMVFVTAGMGGGTGTGASPIIANIARELGALTIGVVTKPFNFEGAQRMRNAEKGISELRGEVDALITIPNQKLLDVSDKTTTIMEAFKLSDSVLNQGVQGIADLIVLPGLINVDFADVKTVMQNAGSALMGIGIGTGENRAEEAAHASISSPLLEQSIEGATGILFNVTGGSDLTMQEVDRAANIIGEVASPDANIIFGTTIDEKFKDQLKITVIATGFDTIDLNYGGRVGIPHHYEAVTPVGTTPRDDIEDTDDTDDRDIEEEPEDFKEETTQENESDHEEDTTKTSENAYDDEYDSKFDIPAFLRGK